MSKIRVHELAKELGKSSKDVIYALKSHGVVVESHMSTISGDSAEKIRRFFSPEKAVKAEPKTAPTSNTNTVKATTENKPQQARPTAPSAQTARPAQQPQTARPAQQPQGARPAAPQGNNRPEGQRPQRPFNKDGQDRPQRPFNKDGQDRPQRPFNKDGQDRPQRPFNKDGQDRPQRPFNKDGQDRPQRPFNKDGQDRPQRPFNKDGQDRPQRPFNKDGQDRPQRPFNKDGQDRNNRAFTFNKDKDADMREGRDNRDNRGGNRGRGDRDQKFNLDSAISKEVVVTKDTSRENRRNYKDTRDKEKNMRDHETEKKPNKGGKNNLVNTKKTTLTPPAQKPKPVVEKVTNIVLPETITLKELGDKMKISGAEIVKKLFLSGKLVSLNSEISYEEAEEIALEYDILCEHEVVVDVIEEMLKEEEEDEAKLSTRPPVVCVMGHVDHGKTSILDAIRKTKVTAGEAGGITQHIGAYVVDVNGEKITFLDTPGHEAFTSMRLRGAQSTDIAILVVAADDGVMPQTVEAISHAKAAEIEIIVAINKIDKPSANIDRVKQELTEHGLIGEDWGGQTIMVPVSAHTGEGLDELLDMILLVAEMRELRANANRKARGLILEAQLDKGRGPVATVLVQKGTLKVGDNVAVGTAYGRVRAMVDDKGRRVKEAGPSTPVEILGLNDVPQAGEIFVATNNEKEARTMAETFIATNREKMLADTKSKLSLDGLFDQIQAGQIKDLNIVVKADVQGSVEAVKQSLVKLSNEEVAVKVIHGGVGAINEGDVTLAAASNAIVIGFNVRPDNMAKTVAEQENVDLRLYRVIYNAIEDIEAAMKGMLEPTFREKIIGHAEVRQTYKVSGVGTIIGGYVLDGKVQRHCKARLLRDNVVLYEGELASLKRFKDDVKEVNSGYECGMSLEKYNDIKEGDQIEMFIMEEVPR